MHCVFSTFRLRGNILQRKFVTRAFRNVILRRTRNIRCIVLRDFLCFLALFDFEEQSYGGFYILAKTSVSLPRIVTCVPSGM